MQPPDLVVFQKASPLREARNATDAELFGKATSSQVQFLYAHPHLWLRSLQRIRHEVESHVAKDRKSLAPLRPIPGQVDTSAYLEAKRAFDERCRGRMHVHDLAERRLEEVKALLGPRPIDRLMVGDIIEILNDIALLADSGDLEAAADKAWFWAKRLDER